MIWKDAGVTSELPIACTLEGSDGAERLARWKKLSANGEPTVRRGAHELVVLYPSGWAVRDELEALAAAERRCCSFADWEVTQAADHVALRVRSDTDGLAAIAAVFGTD
jgi:MerR family transcriptional regulator, copper efflux regulator